MNCGFRNTNHSGVSSAAATIERPGRQVIAIVDDDGVGFDSDSLAHGSASARIGVAGMPDRAALLNGELTVDSSPAHGTTVRVRIPLTTSGSPAAP